MTLSLRKYHRVIWPIIGIVLIGSFFAANKALSDSTLASKVGQGLTLDANVVDDFLKVDLKGSLSGSALLLYADDKEDADISKAKLLGLVNGTGAFQFPIDSTILNMRRIHLFGYEPIKQELIIKTTVSK